MRHAGVHGIHRWIAPRDVLGGIHYGEAIVDAIRECRIMVLVFSSKANISGHIPKEIERAVSQGVTVMQLRIEDVAPAKSLDCFIYRQRPLAGRFDAASGGPSPEAGGECEDVAFAPRFKKRIANESCRCFPSFPWHSGRSEHLTALGPTLGRLPGLSDTIATTDATNPNGGVRLDFLTNGCKYIAAQPTGVNMVPMDVPWRESVFTGRYA